MESDSKNVLVSIGGVEIKGFEDSEPPIEKAKVEFTTKNGIRVTVQGELQGDKIHIGKGLFGEAAR